MRSTSSAFLGLLLSILALSGCYEQLPPPRIVGQEKPTVTLPPLARVPRYHVAGRSVQGSLITTETLGDGDDTTFIMATIHGNEPAGTPLVRRLGEYLRANPRLLEGRTVVIMPVANPDGMALDTRENARGVDLNRNFASGNRVNSAQNGISAVSEPEALAIETVIREHRPDRIVSIHQPLSCIDYDGPGQALAKRMAEYCTLPIKKLGARPGSLGSYAGETLSVPIITMEMLPGDETLPPDVLWQRYGRALLAAITYPLRPEQAM